MTGTFNGFVVPEKNYFPMPNEWIDICAGIDNLAELKVIQYVIRHTWGYHEFGITKTISVEEFMHGRKRNDGTRIDQGTGLKSDRSVKDGIKAALKHGYLICDIDNSDKARIKKSYALKMLPVEGYNLPPDVRQVVSTPPINENRQVVSTPPIGSIYPSEVQNLPLGGAKSTPRSEKDTIERHFKKHTKETQSCASPIVDAEPSDDFAEEDPEKTHEHLQAVKPETPEVAPRENDTQSQLSTSYPQGDGTHGIRDNQPSDGDDRRDTNNHLSSPSGHPSRVETPQQQTLVAPVASKQSARREKKPEPTPEELALKERCSRWYDRLTEWCGGPMTKGGQVINEHRSIKLACQKYSDSQLEAIFTYLTTRDWKYSKIDNKYTVRGYVLWDESGRVAQILREERQGKGKGKSSPAVAAGYTDYTNAAPINYRPLRMPSDKRKVLV